MKKSLTKEDIELLSKKVQYLMTSAGLEIPGFAVFTTFSESYIYSLISKRRPLTIEAAETVGSKFNTNWELLYNISSDIEAAIRNSESLKKFKIENKGNDDYFTSTRGDRKLSYFIEFEIMPGHLFDTPQYVWEISEYCKKRGREIISDKLKKTLAYLVVKGKLRSEKRPIKLRNGEFGTRMVDVFYR